MKQNKIIGDGITFDDVSLVPLECDVIPRDVDISSRFTRGIPIKLPLCSAAMRPGTPREISSGDTCSSKNVSNPRSDSFKTLFSSSRCARRTLPQYHQVAMCAPSPLLFLVPFATFNAQRM